MDSRMNLVPFILYRQRDLLLIISLDKIGDIQLSKKLGNY